MQLKRSLGLYSFLNRFKPFRTSYTAKIMVVAFLGTHVPLLVLLCSFILSSTYPFEIVIRILTIALCATLAGTAATLYALRSLLNPVVLTSAALQNYIHHQDLPQLPTKFTDEAGKLMANTSQTLYKLDELIHYISHYDELTGLPNRDLWRDRLLQTLSPSRSDQRIIAVLVLGIESFREVSYGLAPRIVRLILRAIAQRLVEHVAASDVLAYLNGDEFAIAQVKLHSFEQLIEKINTLLRILAKPFYLEGEKIHITAKIGVTINHLDQQADVDQLLQQARLALGQVRTQRGAAYQFYSPEMNTQLQARLAHEKELYGALERNEFEVHYQPLMDLHTEEITAVEALIRWQHPTRGMVSPAQFIPIAESNGLIVSIGEWALRTACAQNAAWRNSGLPPIRMSVNLSARQFESPRLISTIRQILEETTLDASGLELEVTESFLMTNIQSSIETLTKLRELGVLVALDDFGTGYSSLSYLKRLPVDMLKIDRSFVQDLTVNSESMAITDAIIALAKSLKLHITAEGIETQAQLEYLQRQQCEEGQGFYFSHPVSALIMTTMLEQSARQITMRAV